MRAWSLFGALSAAGGVALVTADVIEPSNFNVTEGLEQLGVDVSSIPALESFSGIQTRSTDGACAAAVSLSLSSSQTQLHYLISEPNSTIISVQV